MTFRALVALSAGVGLGAVLAAGDFVGTGVSLSLVQAVAVRARQAAETISGRVRRVVGMWVLQRRGGMVSGRAGRGCWSLPGAGEEVCWLVPAAWN